MFYNNDSLKEQIWEHTLSSLKERQRGTEIIRTPTSKHQLVFVFSDSLSSESKAKIPISRTLSSVSQAEGIYKIGEMFSGVSKDELEQSKIYKNT
jgi:hypothetical protein